MALPPPAFVGMSIEEVDTPALLIDLDAFESNLDLMAQRTASAGLRLRPHAKTHKCAAIALRQIALGAVGVCCQKVSEAEALVAGGVADVLVTNQIIDRKKIERLAKLAQDAHIGVCVDQLDNVIDLANAAAANHVTLDIYIEVDVGGERCGLLPGADIPGLAGRVAENKSLRFRGIHAYQGRAQHIRQWQDRRRAIEDSSAKAKSVIAALRDRGIECDIVTGAGTGTYVFETASGIYNELQPGSYIFMDADYARNEVADTAPRFRQSLFVYTQVMSVTRPKLAVIDAGLKAVSVDSGMPLIADRPDVIYERASDDHCTLIAKEDWPFQVGEKLKLIPGHCDPTVNLYDWFVGIRGGKVEALWPTARGTIS